MNYFKQGFICKYVSACKNGHLETVQLLYEKKANLKLKNKDGHTAIQVAIINNKQNVVNYLKTIGAQ